MKKIWGIKNCNSVKKALNFLDLKGIQYEFIDYKKFPPERELLKRWIEKVGIEVVFNNRSATYKKLEISDKVLSDDEKITLMSQNPTLIKRPILEDKDQLEFGFDKDKYEKIF